MRLPGRSSPSPALYQFARVFIGRKRELTLPVRLAVGPGKLNRLTVLFRILLAIPAAIVSVLLTSGFTIIVIFIAWLTALIAGRLPACFNVTSLPGAKAFSAFGSTLHATPVPPGSAAIAKRLTAETASTAQDWMEMATADSFTSVENFATAAENVGGKFDNDFSALETSLENEGVTLSAEANTLNNAAAALNHQAAALNRRAVALNVTVSVRAASEAALS
jgi:hypothetical protein